MVGTVGEWSLDKRHYFGAPPPRDMTAPPECAQECAYVWWGMFNEATRHLGQWYPRQTGGDTRSFRQGKDSSGAELSGLSLSLARVGPWVIDGQHKPIHFHLGGRVSSPWGVGKWSVSGSGAAQTVELQLCSATSTIKFDSVEAPTAFTFEGESAQTQAHTGECPHLLSASTVQPPLSSPSSTSSPPHLHLTSIPPPQA